MLVGITVCVWANTISYLEGGGHLWVYLNWALGLHRCGCRVLWLETLRPETTFCQAKIAVLKLKRLLQPYGFSEHLVLNYSPPSNRAASEVAAARALLEEAVHADLLLDMGYNGGKELLSRVRRSALIDIDPGLTQLWIKNGQIPRPDHDVCFTIGETVGRLGSGIPDCDLAWQYTPPCITLEEWQIAPFAPRAAFTTVSQWDSEDYVLDGDSWYENNKRAGFSPFLDLPQYTSACIELALDLGDDYAERNRLQELGWRVRDAREVASNPDTYRAYIRNSRGEFSCVKPSYVRLQTAWISDRSLCYLASGRPVVVQHTGP